MMEISVLNHRRIIYQQYSQKLDWTKEMPNENWLLIVVAEDKNKQLLNEIARKALDRNVCYVCCLGQQSELLHDIVDEEIVIREVDPEYNPLTHFIVTTWDFNIEKGLWNAIYTANNDEGEINTVFCLHASDLRIEEMLLSLMK
ncbi:DUF7684 family protein [Mucilaginibacter sp. NFX135]|uniref:DUF7684 family protein n=1 Tax=Mucilaginibacter sp. NFX135 TaxID=3402687 RepID=UPI003AFA1956